MRLLIVVPDGQDAARAARRQPLPRDDGRDHGRLAPPRRRARSRSRRSKRAAGDGARRTRLLRGEDRAALTSRAQCSRASRQKAIAMGEKDRSRSTFPKRHSRPCEGGRASPSACEPSPPAPLPQGARGGDQGNRLLYVADAVALTAACTTCTSASRSTLSLTSTPPVSSA